MHEDNRIHICMSYISDNKSNYDISHVQIQDLNIETHKYVGIIFWHMIIFIKNNNI